MAFESWEPDLSLWVEPHTLMSGIKAVLFRSDDSDKTFNMYHTAEIGRSEIVSRNYRNESGGYYCDYCDEVGQMTSSVYGSVPGIKQTTIYGSGYLRWSRPS